MTYDVITIDTSIFDRYKCRLESGLLAKLNQFKGMPTGLIFSEIVMREVAAHLNRHAQDAVKQVDSTLKTCAADLVVSAETIARAEKLLIPQSDLKELVSGRVKQFLDANGGQIIAVESNTSLQAVIGKYFSSEPPFAESGKKKNEFPDALALLSLEGWAAKNNLRVLAVSSDGDWKQFADKSDVIDCMDDLAAALSLFQPDNDAHKFCEKLGELLSTSPENQLSDSILDAVANAVGELTPYAEADGPFYFEPDHVELEVKGVEFYQGEEVTPVQAQKQRLAVQTQFWVTASATCNIEFSMKDSIDKDYISMGSFQASTEVGFAVDALIQLAGDFSRDHPDITVENVEILSELNSVEFGYIEPDWMHEPDA